MNNAELAQNVILETVKTSGADGATEGQIVSALVTKHRINYHDALSLVQENYTAAGVKRCSGAVVRYQMPPKQKEEPAAVKLVREMMKNRGGGEIEGQRILDHYRAKRGR